MINQPKCELTFEWQKAIDLDGNLIFTISADGLKIFEPKDIVTITIEKTGERE